MKVLTAYGFSTENWTRSKEEVDYLMDLLKKCLVDNLDRYKKNGLRVRVIGQRERLPESLQKAVEKTEEATKDNKSLFFAYKFSTRKGQYPHKRGAQYRQAPFTGNLLEKQSFNTGNCFKRSRCKGSFLFPVERD